MGIDEAYRAGMLDATAVAEKRNVALTEMLRAVETERDMLKRQVAELTDALSVFIERDDPQKVNSRKLLSR